MGHVARIVKMKNAYNMLVGSSEGKRPLEKPKHRWEDNSRKDLREIVWEGVDWIHLAQDRDRWWALVNAVMVLRGSMKGREFLD